MDRKPNIGTFVGSLGRNWVTLMSGGLIIVILTIGERFLAYSVSRWAYGVFVAALLVVASYRAWTDERKRVNELEGRARALEEKPAQAVPELQVEIKEAIIQPVLHNTMRCFLRVTLRNLTEDAPCMVERSIVRVRINETWYESGTSVDVHTAQLVTIDQMDNPSMVPLNTPYHLDDDGLPIIEVGREEIPSLLDNIGENHPLRRGFPKSAWLGFFIGNLPNWPTQTKGTGHYESEIDRETGEEFYVEETRVVRSTKVVQELELQVIDGHGGVHRASKVRPFGVWNRTIDAEGQRHQILRNVLT
jgi:hypothetical protein